MKLRTLALAGAAVLAMSVPASAGDTTGWYIGLGAGWDKLVDFNNTLNTTTVGRSGTNKTIYSNESDSGFLIEGNFGYRFADRLRVENEIGYSRGDVKGKYNGIQDYTGTFANWTDYVNLVYDIPVANRWNLSIGGGLGAARIGTTFKDTGTGNVADNSSVHFTVQAIAGLNYALSDNTEIGVDYRYRYFSGSQSGNWGIAGCTYSLDIPAEHAVLFNIRYFLEAAPPPPPVKTFIVFFDFNKSNLTQAAQAIVTEAVSTAKKNGFVKVQIVGHTDTVGSDKYNLKLSVSRATTVKEEMVRQGLDGSGIAIQGKGFHDLLVPTGPGVREPQNRRATIDLGN